MGTHDEEQTGEGWSPTSGEPSDAVKEGNKKAWEANETQDASRGSSADPGAPGDDADSAPDDVGESTSRRAEDIAKKENEAGREDTGTKGQTDRPTGTSSGRDVSSVKPHDSQSERSDQEG